MKPVNWWYPAVIVVGAVAGFAVAGRSEPIIGDRALSLEPAETASTTTSVPTPADGAATDSPPATEAPTPDLSAVRVVLAVPADSDEASVAEIVAALNAEGLSSVVTSAAQVEVTATQVRVGEGFDDAVVAVLRVLGLTDAAVVLPDSAAASQVWSGADDQADVIVLLGPDVVG